MSNDIPTRRGDYTIHNLGLNLIHIHGDAPNSSISSTTQLLGQVPHKTRYQWNHTKEGLTTQK